MLILKYFSTKNMKEQKMQATGLVAQDIILFLLILLIQSWQWAHFQKFLF